MSKASDQLLSFYPKIFFACHTQHVRDPDSDNVLTSKQASILDHLDIVDPVSLNGLAKHMGVTSATICVAIDRLEALEYVKRERSQEDKRVVQLRLTASGLKVREAHSVLDPDRVQAMLSSMSPEDRRRGLDGLELLAKAATEYLEKHGAGWSLDHEKA